MYKLLTLFIVFLALQVSAQNCEVTGKVKGPDKSNFEFVNIIIKGTGKGVVTNSKGEFTLNVPCDKDVEILVTHVGFENQSFVIDPIDPAPLEIKMENFSTVIDSFEFVGEQTRATTMEKISVRELQFIPSASGNFEQILFSRAGVSSNNEMSSQYSVRGGNFDENLVYVNDIQIYRPFLIRSGQQEGLSFINSNLVSDIQFSAGGFDAKYGDKMSSVLDITYKKPTKFAGSVSGSLLGGAVHIEDATDNLRFRHIHGFRYKTNQYILNSLETQGAYAPSFFDYQTYLTYDVSSELELAFLGNVSRNQYKFKPESRESDFGTINQALRLTVYFDGQEVDEYLTTLGAFTVTYKPTYRTKFKFITSIFNTQESETFDILGQYRLDELEKDISQDDFGDVAFNLGVGSFLNHARNYLDATVMNFEHKGDHLMGNTKILWGAKYQKEIIIDELSEWTLIDSAGYSLPHASDKIELNDVHNTINNINADRAMAYTQMNHNWTANEHEMTMHAGIRSHWWSINNQIVVSPRATFSLKPKWKRDFLFRLSSGVYHQPPFYREYRRFDGSLNEQIQAQTSIHFVAASDFNFKAWGRPFKMVNELYYKNLQNLIPYEIDNVRIRYYAKNNANGYAVGLDTKINGEFVKGVDSWVSVSVMKIMEDLTDDYYYEYYNAAQEKIIPGVTLDETAVDSVRFEPGSVPRPTDQIVNFGLFFQDYIPNHPEYKMHLNVLYGSGLPTGPPTFERYKDTLRIPSYRRVDIGFSRQLLKEDAELSPKNPFKHFKSIWVSLEVFNLLEINNTISYLWVKDSWNRQFAIPNYLTARRINLRLLVNF